MNNLNQFAKIIAEIEGGKQNLKIAQIKEVLRIVSELIVDYPYLQHLLLKNGLKRKKPRPISPV